MKKKIIIILVVLNLLILGVGTTYSTYRSKTTGGLKEFQFAKIIFNNEITNSISLPLNDFMPGNINTYDFQVANNKDGKKSDVNIGYKIYIETLHLIPTTINLYKVEDTNKTNILTCNENNERNSENKIVCITEEEILYYSNESTNNYELEVIFEEKDSNGNSWSSDYSDLIDFIDIKIDSYQKTE